MAVFDAKNNFDLYNKTKIGQYLQSSNLLIELMFILFIYFTAGIRKIILIPGSMSNIMNN